MQLHKQELVPVGDSVGLPLPEDVLTRMGLKKGDWICLTDIPGGFAITPHGQVPSNLSMDGQDSA
jgi:hypothetical protein